MLYYEYYSICVYSAAILFVRIFIDMDNLQLINTGNYENFLWDLREFVLRGESLKKSFVKAEAEEKFIVVNLRAFWGRRGE